MEKIKGLAEEMELLGGDFKLNELLNFEFENDNEISIHVAKVPNEGVGEKLKLLREGFKKLATMLKERKALENISLITATSWIVTENPGLMKKLGFAIDNNVQSDEAYKHKREYFKRATGNTMPPEKLKIESTYSYITRDRFIQLYGEQN